MHADPDCNEGSYFTNFKKTRHQEDGQRQTGEFSFDSIGWVAIPTDLDLSFSIPRGFTVTLRESPDSDNMLMLTGSGAEECQVVDVNQLGWTPTPDTVVSIERDWMIEFYETEDCTGTPLLVQFDEDGDVGQAILEDEGWYERISTAVVPSEITITPWAEFQWVILQGGTSQPLACQSLGGLAG